MTSCQPRGVFWLTARFQPVAVTQVVAFLQQALRAVSASRVGAYDWKGLSRPSRLDRDGGPV